MTSNNRSAAPSERPSLSKADGRGATASNGVMASIASTATITPSSDPTSTAAAATHNVPTSAIPTRARMHRVTEAVKPRRSALGCRHARSRLVGSGKHPVLLPESDDCLCPLDGLDGSTDQLPSFARDGTTGSVAGPLGDPGDQDTCHDERDEDRGNRRRQPEHSKEKREHSNDDGDQGRSDHPNEDVLDLVDVVEGAPDEVSRSERCNSGRTQPMDCPGDPRPQVGEEVETQVVRDEALQIPENGASDAEEPYADDGDGEIEKWRTQRR